MDNRKRNEVLYKLRGTRPRAEVASAIGITERALASYERGERVPRDEIKQRIATFYKRSVQHIFF